MIARRFVNSLVKLQLVKLVEKPIAILLVKLGIK
jgi:hypothetical protein